MRRNDALVRAVMLGAVGGMRSQMPLALLAWSARERQFAVDAGPPLSVLRSPKTLPVAAILAGGELIGDKLPMTPSRLEPGALAARFVVGGLAGAALALDAGQSPLEGVAAGMVGAGLGAYGGYQIRRWLGAASGVPDPVVAIGEDMVAIGIGVTASRGG